MAMIALISLGLLIKNKNIIYLVTLIPSILAMVFTFSRSAWLGFLLALLLATIIYNYKLLIYSPILLLVLTVPQIRNRLAITLTGNYKMASSLDGRLWAMANGLYIFKQHPLIGAGPGSYGGKLAAEFGSPVYLEGIQKGYTALYYTDNQFVELLVQGGILGILSFVGFIVSVITALVRKSLEKKNILVLAMLSTFFCFLIGGFFANVLEYGALAVPMGLILGVALNES